MKYIVPPEILFPEDKFLRVFFYSGNSGGKLIKLEENNWFYIYIYNDPQQYIKI